MIVASGRHLYRHICHMLRLATLCLLRFVNFVVVSLAFVRFYVVLRRLRRI